MDPLTAIGGIAASSQLLSETVKSVNAAYKTVQSFHNAPKELEQVAQKLACARDRIQQIQAFGNDLSNADMDDLFPLAHRTLLFTALNKSMNAFSRLRSLKDAADKNSFRVKLSWAALDKRQVGRIMNEFSETEAILDQTLAIFNARLGTLNRTSLGALRVGQLAMETTGARIENSIANVELMGTDTMSQIQENTILVQSNTTLLQKSLDEHRAHQQQMESMLAAQRQLLQDMQDLKASMALPTPVPSSSESKTTTPTIDHHQVFGEEREPAQEDLPRSPMPGSFLKHHQSQEITFMEWGFGEYHPNTRAARINRPSLENKAASQPSASPLATKLRLKRKTKGKRTDIQARANISVFGSRILQAELRIRMIATAWYSLPSIETKFSTINARPGDAPIFQAIRSLDLYMVKNLMESGEASIHDIVAGSGQTLLTMTISAAPLNLYLSTEWGLERRMAAEAIFAYLLREGCDPNVYAHTAFPHRSLLAWSLEFEANRFPQLLFEHGADIDYPVSAIHSSSKTKPGMLAELEMFQSWGAMDLSTVGEGIRNHIMLCFYKLGAYDVVIPYLENGMIDANTVGPWNTPLEGALQHGSLELATVFIAYGANIKPNGTAGDKSPQAFPLEQALQHADAISGVHLLLFHGLSLDNVWNEVPLSVFNNHNISYNQWFSFDEVVGVAAHMIFHNANCYHLVSKEPPFGGDASEADDSPELRQKVYYTQVKLNELCQERTIWTTKHVICMDDYVGIDKISCRKTGSIESDDDERMIDHTVFTENKNTRFIFLEDPIDKQDTVEPDVACYGKAGFDDLISTRTGRQRLAKYPLATAFWAAITLAGYRADMDDEGDIWWSDDDCDRYYDAREEQPSNDEDGIIQNCPMCQEPEKWGLKSIQDRMNNGLKAVDDYRRRKADGEEVIWPTTYGPKPSAEAVEVHD